MNRPSHGGSCRQRPVAAMSRAHPARKAVRRREPNVQGRTNMTAETFESYSEPGEAYTSGVDGETDFESDFEAVRTPQRYPSGIRDHRTGGGSYYNGPTSPPAVKPKQLRAAPPKGQGDIHRV